MKRVNYGGPSFVVFLEVMCTLQAQNTSKNKESLDLKKVDRMLLQRLTLSINWATNRAFSLN